MKLPKLSLIHLPILLIVTTVVIAGFIGQGDSTNTGTATKVAHGATQQIIQATKQGRSTVVIGSVAGGNGDASASVTTSSGLSTSGATTNSTNPSANSGSQPLPPTTSPQSTSQTQQSTAINSCTDCLSTDRSDLTTGCSDYCNPAPAPAPGGCGVCNNNNAGYPHIHPMCPMYCSPLD